MSGSCGCSTNTGGGLRPRPGDMRSDRGDGGPQRVPGGRLPTRRQDHDPDRGNDSGSRRATSRRDSTRRRTGRRSGSVGPGPTAEGELIAVLASFHLAQAANIPAVDIGSIRNITRRGSGRSATRRVPRPHAWTRRPRSRTSSWRSAEPPVPGSRRPVEIFSAMDRGIPQDTSPLDCGAHSAMSFGLKGTVSKVFDEGPRARSRSEAASSGIIAEIAHAASETHSDASDLSDLGIDSLDQIELVMEMEEEFDIMISDDVAMESGPSAMRSASCRRPSRRFPRTGTRTSTPDRPAAAAVAPEGTLNVSPDTGQKRSLRED